MVLIQQTELSCPKVAKFREIFAKVISDKHEDVIAKFGATLAQGILDAGKFLQDQNSGQSMVISTINPKPANTAFLSSGEKGGETAEFAGYRF